MVGRLIISVAFLISLASGLGTSETQNKNLYESNLIMKSLEKALGYLKNRPEIVTDDVVLGVLIARANLQWIYNRFKYYFRSNTWLDGQVVRLLNHCSDVITTTNSTNYDLLKEDLWEDAAENLKYGFLKELGFQLPDFDSCQSIDTYLMRGTPEDSDFCLNELLTANCDVSEYCWLSEVNGDVHSGYKTSHRLLYFQVAMKMNCQEINPIKFLSATAIKIKLCQQMLSEAIALFHKPILSLTRDLFMEQIALCGLEGFEEFAPENWRTQVRNWQSFSGCFGWSMDFGNCSVDALRTTEGTTKLKRTDLVSDDCHSHVTAVGIAALAFFLRATLKLAFNIP